jgi:hypothetical protein
LTPGRFWREFSNFDWGWKIKAEEDHHRGTQEKRQRRRGRRDDDSENNTRDVTITTQLCPRNRKQMHSKRNINHSRVSSSKANPSTQIASASSASAFIKTRSSVKLSIPPPAAPPQLRPVHDSAHKRIPVPPLPQRYPPPTLPSPRCSHRFRPPNDDRLENWCAELYVAGTTVY